AARRRAKLIIAEAREEADRAREEADRALSEGAQIIRYAREQAEKIISDAYREAEQIKAQAASDHGPMTPTAHNEFTGWLMEVKTGLGKEQPGSGRWKIVTYPARTDAPDTRSPAKVHKG